jgi:hypothetical protein
MVAHTCNPNSWEANAKGSQVQGQPGLYIARLCLKEKKIRERSKVEGFEDQ